MFASERRRERVAVIARLDGSVVEVGLDHLVLLVGGIGFEVQVSPAHAQSVGVGEALTVHTSMVVREDSMTLYGFTSVDEREVFVRLQSVSGIGPRTALAALSVLDPDQLRRAVSEGDLATLQRIPGVGRKSAQRMVLDIGDKLGLPAMDLGGAQESHDEDVVAEVSAALVQLGWTQAAAQAAVEPLAGQGLGASDLLRAALVSLGGRRG